MSSITSICPRCAAQEVPADQVRLVHCTVDRWSFYEFVCPECHEAVRLPAPTAVRDMLKRYGVQAQLWDVPAEADEDHVGPPITVEDVRDFVLALGELEVEVAELRHRRGSH